MGLSFGPMAMFVIFISFITQCLRKLGLPTNQKITSNEERKMLFVKEIQSTLKKVAGMNWRSILVKAMWLGIFYQSVYIGISKLTSVFLSWFNDILLSSGMSFAQVTLAFIVIGMIMFFIPVIPGVPVYVSGGIIVVNVGWKEMGFWNACIFTTGICCILKGSAIFVQQKGFGGILGKYISIRRTVGVNSVTIKAIKL